MRSILVGLFLLLALIISACDSDTIVREFYTFEGNGWPIDSTKVFTFSVDESQQYDLYYHIRNEIDYPFYNLYLKCELKDIDGKILESKMHEVMLMDEKLGRPFGSGGGGVYDHEVLLFPNYLFPESGEYSFSMQQYMRRDTLPNIQAVGFTLKGSKTNDGG